MTKEKEEYDIDEMIEEQEESDIDTEEQKPFDEDQVRGI